MKFKGLAVALAASLALTGLVGCGAKDEAKTADGTEKVTISVGNWPGDNNPEKQAEQNAKLEKMKELYPNIEVVPDEYAYTVDTFLPKAASNQLPTVYATWFPEVTKIAEGGYAMDLTAAFEKYGYAGKYDKQIMDIVSRDGKVYGVPTDAYAMGLHMNRALFEQAGLVDENGVPIAPKTYEELAETAKTIKEKTGKAGYIMPSLSNIGGWHFMNIAWSYGAEFMKQEGEKWVATFDSPEAIEAMQFVKDLKWKYDCLPENTNIDYPETKKLFATDQAAMFIQGPPCDDLTDLYKMDVNNIAVASVPAGPKGRFAQTGGNLLMISSNATEEQVDAVFKWLEVDGYTPKVSEENKATWQKTAEVRNQKGRLVGPQPYKIYSDPERVGAELEAQKPYVNVDLKMFEDYEKFEGVSLHAEPPVCCQELYTTLTNVIQAVLTDENADVEKLMQQTNADFQKNYLDKV